MVCTAFLRKCLEFQTIKSIPINLIINYCIAFNWHYREGSNETRVAINGENVFYSIHHQLLILIHVMFVPEIICAAGLKIWQYLFLSERDVAGKLLLVPFQPLCSLDEHHVLRLNSQSSSFYSMLDQPEIGK